MGCDSRSYNFFVVALVGGFFWGLEGLLLGGIVSKVVIVGLWKPYFLFKKGFNESVANYWRLWFKHVCIIAVSYFICSILYKKVLVWITPITIFTWFTYAIILSLIYFCIAFILMWLFAPGMKSMVSKLVFNLKKK